MPKNKDPHTRYGETWDYTATSSDHYIEFIGEKLRGKCKSGQPYTGDMILLNNGKTRIRLANVQYPEGKGYKVGRLFEAEWQEITKPTA